MLSGRRGQVSTELMIILAIMFIIFLALLLLAQRNSRIATEKMTRDDASYVSRLMSIHLTNVFVGGHGTKTNFVLPGTLGRATPYTARILPSQHVVAVQYASGSASASIPSFNVTGTSTIAGATNVSIQNNHALIVVTAS